MVLELNGTDKVAGAIATIEKELQQPISFRSNLTFANLQTLGSDITTTIAELYKKQQALAAASQQVSFKQLYEAVSKVQRSSPSECPACKTSLEQVVINPYTRASEELKNLQQLAVIQQETEALEQKIKQLLFNLSQIINVCLKHYPQNNQLKVHEKTNNEQPDIQWWERLEHTLSDGFTSWQHVESQVQHLEDADKKIDKEVNLRSEKQQKLNSLREYARQITVLQTRRQTANVAIVAAQQLINSFEIENNQLIVDVEAEKVIIKRNQKIASSYSTFVKMLNRYNNNLPAQLVADLGEVVVHLYNAFNRNDSDSELLVNVKLPLSQNQRMEIAFKNQPNKFYDALHILSEGHIRCLGLAILLAKNLKGNAPILIFDDPVNAIDDNHKDSIRKTLFEDDYFSDKQIILTCHGEEFFKDIHNLLPAQTANQAKSFTFLPRLGESHIRVDFNCAPRNYILQAKNHIQKLEIRDSLVNSRQALEALTKGKIWRYVNRYGNGTLSILMNHSADSIQLRNLTEQLKSKISKNDFGDPDKENILVPLEQLLGLNGDSREWRYLNKGVHEESDRAEFDRHTVGVIVSNLEQLDQALK